MNETTPPEARKARFRGARIVRVSIAVLVLAAGGVWGGDWLGYRAGHVFENDARIAADMIAVSSRVEGWVVKRPVAQGDTIVPGQLLVRIDGREARQRLVELDARITEIIAAREAVRTEIGMIERRTQHRLAAQRQRIEASEAGVEAALAHLRLMESEQKRMASLAGRRVASEQRLDKANADLRAGQEALRRARAELASERALLLDTQASGEQAEVLRKSLAKLRAEEVRAQAQFEQQRLNVEDRRILSPISGVVDKTFVDDGEFVRPGQRLMLIHDPDKIWIDANIRETDLREVALGAAVKVSVDAFPGEAFEGTVISVGSAATSQFALLPNVNPSGNFTKIAQRIPIRVGIDQVAGKLRPGMMVEIEIVSSKAAKSGS